MYRYSDWKPDHWVNLIHRRRTPYLRAYKTSYVEDVSLMKHEGELIQSPIDKQVYLIQNGTKKGFPNLNTFLSMKYNFENVEIISVDDMNLLTNGGMLPTLG